MVDHCANTSHSSHVRSFKSRMIFMFYFPLFPTVPYCNAICNSIKEPRYTTCVSKCPHPPTSSAAHSFFGHFARCCLIQKNGTKQFLIVRKGKAVPLQVQRSPEGSRKLRFPDYVTTAQHDGKVVRKCSWYSFPLEAESIPGPQCDRKDFMSMKVPETPAGIEPATFRFVTQHLNHCATAVPLDFTYQLKFCTDQAQIQNRMIIQGNHCQFSAYDLQLKLENGDTQKCMFVYYRSIYQNYILGWLLVLYSLAVTVCAKYCNMQKLSSLHAHTQKSTHTVYVCLSINS